MHETLKIHTFTMKGDSMEVSWMGVLHEYAMKFLLKNFAYETLMLMFRT